MTNDLFAEWEQKDQYEVLPEYEGNKDLDELLEDIKKEGPVFKYGRRVPFAIFHTVKKVTEAYYETDSNGEYIRTASNQPIRRTKTFKKNCLVKLDLSGSHGIMQTIQFYHMKYKQRGKGLVYYWFPDVNVNFDVSSGAVQNTIQKETPGAIRNRGLASFCEDLKSMNPRALQALTQEKEALEQRVKELEAASNGTNKGKQTRNRGGAEAASQSESGVSASAGSSGK